MTALLVEQIQEKKKRGIKLALSVHLKNFLLKLVIVVIEQLPVELRDRFTDMREMDLQVQSKYSVF